MFDLSFKKSWKLLIKEPILLLPDTLFLVIEFILGFLFLRFSGVLELVELTLAGKTVSNEVIKTFITSNFIQLLIGFSLFILTSFIFGSSLRSFKYNLLKKVIENKKTFLFEDFREGQHNFLRVVKMRVFEFLIVIAFSFVIAFLAALVTFFTSSKSISLVVSGFVLIISIIFVLIVKLALLYRYPIMFYGNLNTLGIVKKSISIFKKNKKKVFIVFLIIFAVNLLFGLVNSFFNVSFDMISVFSFLVLVSIFIRIILSIIQSTWGDLFVFITYKIKE